MNMLQEKIKKSSKILVFVLRIAAILISITAAICLVGLLIVLLAEGDVRASFLQAVSLPTRYGSAIDFPPVILSLLFAIELVTCLFMVVILWYLLPIFQSIGHSGAPFQLQHGRRLNKIARAVVGLSMLRPAVDGLLEYVAFGKFFWEFDLFGVTVAVVLYVLALIFDYGCHLQQQSDETL